MIESLNINSVLAVTTTALLVFVSGGVLYLSTIEWRDRRRRQQPVQPSARARK